jgi:hypothetical protein
VGRHKGDAFGIGASQRIIELEWLEAKGIVLDPDLTYPPSARDKSEIKKIQERREEILQKALQRLGQEEMPKVEQYLEIAAATRMASIRIGREEPYTLATSLFPGEAQVFEACGDVAAPVISVILDLLPEPADEVPLEDVLAFNTDATTQNRMTEFRSAIADLGRGGFKPAELLDKIQSSLDLYAQHVKLSNIKANQTRWEILVSTTVEMASTLSLSPLVKALATARTKTIMKREAELEAPGREFAWIAHAQQALESQR